MKANISGKKIKNLRSDRGWTQIDLVAALDVDHQVTMDRSDISEIERGVRGVKDFELLAFAKVFNVGIDKLLDNS
jgi:transcriptional regulator with XRE-family HTH domain